MTKQLILMRHAKSDWGSPELSDHDRPLNDRGRASAPQMAQWIREQGFLPDCVLCSTAVRAQQTIEAMLPQWPEPVPVHSSRNLYLAAPAELLAAIRSDGMQSQVVMVVAHNPGLEILVAQLAEESCAFPTAAIAVFELQIDDWSQLHPDRPRRCLAIQRPKEL